MLAVPCAEPLSSPSAAYDRTSLIQYRPSSPGSEKMSAQITSPRTATTTPTACSCRNVSSASSRDFATLAASSSTFAATACDCTAFA